MKATFTYWKESDGKDLGYLNSHPDHWTRGKDLEDLKAHIRDLYAMFSTEDIAVDPKGRRARGGMKRRVTCRSIEVSDIQYPLVGDIAVFLYER
jgi:hypothetical protein